MAFGIPILWFNHGDLVLIDLLNTNIVIVYTKNRLVRKTNNLFTEAKSIHRLSFCNCSLIKRILNIFSSGPKLRHQTDE